MSHYLVIETITTPTQEMFTVIDHVQATTPQEAVLQINRVGRYRAIDITDIPEIQVRPSITPAGEPE